jgi:TonB-dependent starch-binding outer membrane protein SusC
MAAYGTDGSVLRSFNSYIISASYNFNETYFISAVANISKVKEGLYANYYALFPSLSLSWDIANEWFLSGLSWLDYFNIYANWGKSGNYPLNGLANDLYENSTFSDGYISSNDPSV